MRINDFIQSFPVFILAMAIVSVTGPRTENLIGVIAFLNIAVFVRLMRGEVLSIREHEFIEAARCSGSSGLRIVFEHLLPNAVGPSLVVASANIGFAILLTAGLSFIGAGIRTPTPEWGLMVSMGARNMILGQWWPAFFPGIAIGIAVLGFALLGDGIKDLIDPTKRK
jgi:peptide/nickel transport system permease protein